MEKLRFLMAIIFLVFVIPSCEEDEGFTQVTEFEQDIHDAINGHRTAMGKPKMKLEFLFMNDAQQYSAKLANGSVTFGTEGISDDMETLKVNIGADLSGVWVATCAYENADSVLNIALGNAEVKALIEGNFNLAAVGARKSTTGTYYITQILMHKP